MKTTFKSILYVMLAVVLCAFTLSGCGDMFDSGSSGGGGHGGGNFVPMDGNASHSKDTDKGGETDGESSEDIIYKPPTGGYTKRVALTFDDGPHVERTKMLADELAKYGYHATFFVVGNRVDGTEYNGGAAMKYAVSKGNEIGIHAYTHDIYYNKEPAKYEEEIRKTEAAIKSVVPGYKVKLLRPAGGNITDAQVAASKYSIIMWDVDSEDWRYRSDENGVDIIVENVMSQVKDGSIILMHDIYENSYLAAVEIIRRLHEEGYEVVTVSELIGSGIKTGTKYFRKPKEA